MASFKDPAFQDRVAAAAAAKQKALDKLRAKPPVDPAVLAERTATRLAKEAKLAEQRAADKAAREQAKAEEAARIALEKEAAEAAAAAEAEAAARAVPTEAERKLARDARYAARKKRAK
jgi:hypothetical protein